MSRVVRSDGVRGGRGRVGQQAARTGDRGDLRDHGRARSVACSRTWSRIGATADRLGRRTGAHDGEDPDRQPDHAPSERVDRSRAAELSDQNRQARTLRRARMAWLQGGDLIERATDLLDEYREIRAELSTEAVVNAIERGAARTVGPDSRPRGLGPDQAPRRAAAGTARGPPRCVPRRAVVGDGGDVELGSPTRGGRLPDRDGSPSSRPRDHARTPRTARRRRRRSAWSGRPENACSATSMRIDRSGRRRMSRTGGVRRRRDRGAPGGTVPSRGCACRPARDVGEGCLRRLAQGQQH